MVYMGSKRRIARDIIPIMVGIAKNLGATHWVEPFVGGANLIDKVPQRFKRTGYDANHHTIMALRDIRDNAKGLPSNVTPELYNSLRGSPPATITSWIRFACSFAAKFEGGYARSRAGDDSSGMARGRKANALKQQPLLQDINFIHACFTEINIQHRSVIYCDPPYQNTTGYKAGEFNHDVFFFSWAREQAAKGHLVFISEYIAPGDFVCVWQREINQNLNNQGSTIVGKPVEQLFMVVAE